MVFSTFPEKKFAMAINNIFENIYKLTHEDGQNEFISWIKQHNESYNTTETHFKMQKSFLHKIIVEVDSLGLEIKNDSTILISVRNQKLLRTCFQLVTSLGIAPCLIPGLGVGLHKRCASAMVLPTVQFTDEQKYIILTTCTDFFTRSYEVPVLKNIIMTFHLSDYLAALMQLSFAPLKKPGIYSNFTMTEDMHQQLNKDRQKYIETYEYLVANCFQPSLMKELLVLQSVTEPTPPAFVKRVIAKEMSRRLLVPGGLLSLIRCFIESYEVDTGSEWKKIDMICKIIAAKHGQDSQENYLNNICAQLTQILLMNNIRYITIAVSCILSLHESHPKSTAVRNLVEDSFKALSIENLAQMNLPGTILLSPQEIEHKINILHASTSTSKLDIPVTLLSQNTYLLFLLGVKCSKNEEMNLKLKDCILKCLEQLRKKELMTTIQMFLFGHQNPATSHIKVDESETGLTVKCTLDKNKYCKNEATMYFLYLFDAFTDSNLIENAFESLLLMVIELNSKRHQKANNLLVEDDDNIVILEEISDQYASVLQVLSEISTTPKVLSAFKTNPSTVLNFIEHFILESQNDSSEECLTISLVLLNTILTESNDTSHFIKRLSKIVPVLKKIAQNGDDSNFNSVLGKEALSLISSEKPLIHDSPCAKAISEVYDHLLPVRAHGVIELTKLIDSKDPETISKKHYLFCLFQEQLKDPDSYLYLSAINGIAALGTHCTEEVLQVLCSEFLQVSHQTSLDSKTEENRAAELRLKIGDIIVKVTKRLGEMAIVHKALLLNTMLCGCRDEDPLIRTSALSNLAEIVLVLHYKIGTIIYEVLLCIRSILESDKAVECRRSAVMVITSLLKGLGRETLIQLKENLLPIYRTLKNLYKNEDEDSVVRLHAQLALEELNNTVQEFLLPELKLEKQIFVSDVKKPDIVFK